MLPVLCLGRGADQSLNGTTAEPGRYPAFQAEDRISIRNRGLSQPCHMKFFYFFRLGAVPKPLLSRLQTCHFLAVYKHAIALEMWVNPTISFQKIGAVQ